MAQVISTDQPMREAEIAAVRYLNEDLPEHLEQLGNNTTAIAKETQERNDAVSFLSQVIERNSMAISTETQEREEADEKINDRIKGLGIHSIHTHVVNINLPEESSSLSISGSRVQHTVLTLPDGVNKNDIVFLTSVHTTYDEQESYQYLPNVYVQDNSAYNDETKTLTWYLAYSITHHYQVNIRVEVVLLVPLAEEE